MPSWVGSSLSPPTRKKGRAQVGPAGCTASQELPPLRGFAAGNQLAQRFIAALVQG